MNQAEEDVILFECAKLRGKASLYGHNITAYARLAIRAAVAAERKRCAKVCEEELSTGLGAEMADAIRRGE